jgi:D-alanine-D-alanine ligase
MKQDWNASLRYEVPARLTGRELDRLERAARECFAALGCRDVARLDFRMDADGRVHFIECNPLPGLAPGWSDLVLIAQAAGIDYRGLIGEILSLAIRRLQERERERERARRAQAAVERLAAAAGGDDPRPTAHATEDTPAAAGAAREAPQGPSGTPGDGAPPV